MLIVDSHLDLAYNVTRGRDVTKPAAEQPIADNEIATVGLPDLRAGGVGLICATIFCSPRQYRREGYTDTNAAHAIALKQLDWYKEQVADGRLAFVTSGTGLQPVHCAHGSETHATKTQQAILLMEGADALRTPDDVKKFFDEGLRIIGLAWKSTRMAGGMGEPGPLTDEGKQTVRAMDSLHMIHDASHLAEESFWNLLEFSDGPVMASHSNCRAIVPTDRQISDDMIKAIGARNGVVGIVFYDKFLMPPNEYGTRRCTLADVLCHVNRMCDLIGDAKHVGLGTDMDGGLGREEIPQEIRTSADLPRVADALSAAGFNDEDVRGIMGENWLNFFRRALPAS